MLGSSGRYERILMRGRGAIVESAWYQYGFLEAIGLLKDIGSYEFRRHTRKCLRRKLYVSILESGDVVMFGIVVGSLEDAFIETGVVNRCVDSNGLANLWARLELYLRVASVDLLVVSPNLGLHGSQ
jgi:hypothetical protein